MKFEIMCIGKFPDQTIAELTRRYSINHFINLPDPADVPADVAARIRAVATVTNHGITRALLAKLPNVGVIAVFGVGTDAVDLEVAKERGIPVTNTPNVVGPDVADLAIGMMLASARQIVYADQYVRTGEWVSKGHISLGRSVGGKVCGVIGLGAIGRAIADRAAAFRMNVLYTATREKKNIPYTFVGDLVELARRSDFLMVACKGGPETRHLVSRSVIDAVGPAGTLINIARGSVVEEEALIDALANKRLGYAALDVFASEPNIDRRLLNFPNVILQPHHATATTEARLATGRLVIDNLAAHFENRPLLSPLLG